MRDQRLFKQKRQFRLTLISLIWIGTTGPALAQSIQVIRAAAHKEDAMAQAMLGADYYNGRSLPQNYGRIQVS
jgi:TPR repeat protein